MKFYGILILISNSPVFIWLLAQFYFQLFALKFIIKDDFCYLTSFHILLSSMATGLILPSKSMIEVLTGHG